MIIETWNFVFISDGQDKPFEVTLFKQPTGLGMSLIGGGQQGEFK